MPSILDNPASANYKLSRLEQQFQTVYDRMNAGGPAAQTGQSTGGWSVIK